jgi:hypothetical protein
MLKAVEKQPFRSRRGIPTYSAFASNTCKRSRGTSAVKVLPTTAAAMQTAYQRRTVLVLLLGSRAEDALWGSLLRQGLIITARDIA